jgi:HK97 family phage prohead protease
MTGQLTAPIEWKAVDGAAGELDGYGVFFNNIDLGDDVALPGSCRKTLADREASGRPWPLIADHELATTGMVGSVPKAREDGSGVRLRARFASTQKAQDIRTLALEGHPLGMSITYNALQHYPGTKDGRQVRFLKEIRIHEFTITPFPMNPEARVLAVKAASDDADLDADLERLQQLEAWAAGEQARAVLEFEVEHPEAVAYAAGVLVDQKARHDLAGLEQWALSQPYQPRDPQEQAAEMHRARRSRANQYSLDLARWKSSVTVCTHPGCLVGACKYRTG